MLGRRKHKWIAVFTLAGILLSTVGIPAGEGASQTDINSAIAKGLAYLSNTQNADGSWSGYPVASTAEAVLAFENSAHYGWNTSDPYHNTVQNGLNWLFSQASVQAIDGTNSAGDPDTNGNGFGIGWYGDGQPVYETPMALMAIVASNAQTSVTATGPTDVVGRTYLDVAQDIVDWIAWAQNSVATNGQYEGGWRYWPQYGDSDNSLSQWPVMGLLAAQLWGVNAPSWVKTELQKWVTASQDLTGNYLTNPVYGAFDYQPSFGLYTPAESATGILSLTYIGAANTDSRILAAEGWLNKDWTPDGWSTNGWFGWNWNIGDLYGMYAVMKAMKLTIPVPTTFVTDYTGSAGIDWYNGTAQYADSLLAHQWADGHWNNWVSVEEGWLISDVLGTSWATLILEFIPVRVTYTLTVHINDAKTNNPIPGADVVAVGPMTLSGVTDGGMVVFNGAQAGTYHVTASKTGYISASVDVTLITNRDITLALSSSTIPKGAMTGYGRFDVPFLATHGFAVRCDPSAGPSKIESNWRDAKGVHHNFQLTSLTSAACYYDSSLGHTGYHLASFNTWVGNGTGILDGKAGFSIYAVFTDQGEPARGKDPSTFIITGPSGVVLDINNAVLLTGIHRAHDLTTATTT
jgi:hypothetical protein